MKRMKNEKNTKKVKGLLKDLPKNSFHLLKRLLFHLQSFLL
jgi:hypothetical protein